MSTERRYATDLEGLRSVEGPTTRLVHREYEDLIGRVRPIERSSR